MAVCVFLHSCYADWELGYILPELIANKRPVLTFAMTPDRVKSLGGLTVLPDKTFADLDRSQIEALILPGGDFWPKFENQEFAQFVRDLKNRHVPVAGICAASGYLGRIGLLDDLPHTSNRLAYLKSVAPKYRGQEHYQDRPAVTGDRVVTASGFGAVEFTYELLKLLKVYNARDCEIWYRAAGRRP